MNLDANMDTATSQPNIKSNMAALWEPKFSAKNWRSPRFWLIVVMGAWLIVQPWRELQSDKDKTDHLRQRLVKKTQQLEVPFIKAIEEVESVQSDSRQGFNNWVAQLQPGLLQHFIWQEHASGVALNLHFSGAEKAILESLQSLAPIVPAIQISDMRWIKNDDQLFVEVNAIINQQEER